MSNTNQPQTFFFGELLAAFVTSAQGTFLAQDRDSNFPSENSIALEEQTELINDPWQQGEEGLTDNTSD